MIKEKKCKYCHKYFTFDDGTADQGLGSVNPKVSRITEPSNGDGEVKYGFCPRCDDPQYVYELSYKKENILWMFEKYLRSKNIAVDVLPPEVVLEMMKNFPRTYAAYTSNGTYRTITLFPGTRFRGQYGEFELGIAFEHNPQSYGRMRIWYNREIICIRCNTKTIASAQKTLFFYLGLKEKRCKKCDASAYCTGHIRDTSGLKGGSEKSEYSDRALAKALNVSRMDYRRYKDEIKEPVPHLPIGTIVGPYEILAAYWDEDPKSYSPKYLIRCLECKQEFRILQKSIQNSQHWCTALHKMR